MSEYHGLSKQENYSIAVADVNVEFNEKLKNKSFLTSAKSIEDGRKKALKKVDDSYLSGRGTGGGFMD